MFGHHIRCHVTVAQPRGVKNGLAGSKSLPQMPLLRCSSAVTMLGRAGVILGH